MLRGFGPDAKRKKFEKTTAISWIKAQRKKQSKKLKIEKKIENRKIVNQSQNRKTKSESRIFFQSRRTSRFLLPEGKLDSERST